jgi:hypothetical protein
MPDSALRVPVPLLLSPDLSASAKLVRMIAGLPPASDRPARTAWLCASSGLSRPTVLKAITDLAVAGWTPTRGATDPTVLVPAALLTDRRLSIHARVLYGILPLTPNFTHPSGRFTYAELAALAHASPNTVTKALAQLAKAEWLTVERAHRLDRIRFELTVPGLTQAMNDLARAQWRIGKAEFFGEGLMREYLSLLVDSNDYLDNASPGFLANPRTEALLQLDRYYPPRVAFEFNGAQHYRATGLYTAETAARQRERDYIKAGMCSERGITLVIVHPDDLTLNQMRQKVANLLPLRDLTGYDLLIDYLESESSDYKRSVARL